MKQTRQLMGMPITIELVDSLKKASDIRDIFDYFIYVDRKFSTYKDDSEISMINRKELLKEQCSKDMQKVFDLCEETKKLTNGFFDIFHHNQYDPSGLVKGWAIYNASKMLKKKGYQNFYIDAGGDIQTSGKNSREKNWIIGIRNPFNRFENVKILSIENKGVATSGTAIRGNHIYNPHNNNQTDFSIVSLTVIGPNIYEADRFATATFAMGKHSMKFIELLPGFEAYMIDNKGIATYTSGFEKYVADV